MQDEIQDENNNIEFNLSQKLLQFSMSNEESSQSSNQSEKRPLSDYEDELPQAKRKRKPMKKVERLPIVVSGMDVEQLLGVPALDESTGANEAEVIFESLRG
ncbi:hypothetical protein KQX54_009558 [Cotesia glomerata]|uniref:Uncharacterized protein n=1 Tax=Cotesia glomerata TaxID=32391 RepID=A0AAV7IX69_COTGL|nr:hypothetical protein KQX54_009558 [Cotesia glomerata]